MGFAKRLTVGIRRGAVAKRKRRRLHTIVRRQEDSLPSGEWHYNATHFFQNRPHLRRGDQDVNVGDGEMRKSVSTTAFAIARITLAIDSVLAVPLLRL
jgi:hypothetical protein